MKKFIVLLFVIPSVMFAYTPGKWSHLDDYIIGGKKFGPSKEIVKDDKGNVIYQASYEYDGNGNLIKESYYDKNGKEDGATVIAYKDGMPVSETLYDWNDMVKEKKIFEYEGKRLSKIILYNASHEIELVCKIVSMEKGFVSSAETRWKNVEDSERFEIVPVGKKKTSMIQHIFDAQNNKVGEVRYYFDSSGNLLKRENDQQGVARLNTLEYNKSGRLENFSFHVKQGKNWNKVKTHFLIYDNNNKPVKLAN